MADAKECVDGIKAYDNTGLELVPLSCSQDAVHQNQPPPYMPPPYPMTPYPPPMPPEPGFIMDPPPQYWPKPEEQNPPAETEVTSMPSERIMIVPTAFDDKTTRRAFIRKVFCVVTLQLLVTFSIVCVFTFSQTVQGWVRNNLWVYLSSYIVFAVVSVCLALCSSFSRSHPWNMLGLAVITLSLSYMVGTVASYHNTSAVIIAMGSTLVISFSIVIFSAQTRVDFTLCNGVMLVLAMTLLMFGFFSIFFYSSALQIVYGTLGALLYSLFLAVDCQLVMGREKYGLSPEEYIFAALILYLDIITIFLYLLILFGGSSNN
uniref:Si:ch211-284o19.8 n=1 Tax=Paramormyrops kingsleyae TaxID=1676925 RepID=A0A3B3S2N7_9TELE|nr:protein lifeguard 1-like [Paramormyrops kingsleyae]XP_023688322.1 protein lifeguard 1-like [Paramormyrops kingsleyae]